MKWRPARRGTLRDTPGVFLGLGALACMGLVLGVLEVIAGGISQGYITLWGWVLQMVPFAVVAVGGLYLYFHFRDPDRDTER